MASQSFNQGNVSFAFQNPNVSSVTQVPGVAGHFVRSDSRSSQNRIPSCLNMQNPGNPYGINHQGSCGQNHFGQPMQQDPCNYDHQQNPCLQSVQPVSMNPCICAPGMGQGQMIPCGNFLPQNILDQIRSCVGTAAPIFILPNSPPQVPQVQQNPAPQFPASLTGYPPQSYPIFATPPPGYQIPGPQSFYDQFAGQYRTQTEKSATCSCCRRNNSPQFKSSASSEENEHRCYPGNDDTVCTKASCPASVNLQALASQLLSLQGVIPCAATRLVLRKVPGSNVTTSLEETMERAQKSIATMTRDQLINEARNVPQVNGLINLHMVSNPPQNIVPVLTMLQLKVNGLKALVENLVNKSVGECQSIGMDGNTSLDPMLLGLKSDPELREVLATLREKECEERVNVSYAPYHSQRVVAESRLANYQHKINQVEAEFERRRAVAMPWANFSQFNQGFSNQQVKDPGKTGFESPSPFVVQVRNPRRLNLKPNVGGPATTHRPAEEEGSALAVRNLEKEDDKPCSGKEEASEPGQGGVEVKKKLKIHIDEKGELSVKKQSLEELGVGEFVQVSPDVVIVIDKIREEPGGQVEEKRVKISKKLKSKQKNKAASAKSEESIPSDYSECDSESSESEEKDQKRKSHGLKNPLKGKKKTSKSEKEDEERVSRDEPGPRAPSIEKEKRVDVVMLSEILQDPFILRDHKDARGSDSVSFLEDGPDHPVIAETEEYRLREELDIVRENADDTFEMIYGPNRHTVLMMMNSSNNSVAGLSAEKKKKNSMEDGGNCGLKRSGQLTLLKEAQIRVPSGSVDRNSCIHDKENVTVADRSTETCSTLGKKNRDNNRNLGGSISSMDKDHRRRFNYRFK